MIIESTKVDVNASQEEIFNFLTNSNNIIHLLPQDKISDWQSTDTECSFKAQGGFKISLIQDGSEGKSKVFMKSGEKSPFPFKLTLFIKHQKLSFLVCDSFFSRFLKYLFYLLIILQSFQFFLHSLFIFHYF